MKIPLENQKGPGIIGIIVSLLVLAVDFSLEKFKLKNCAKYTTEVP